MPNNTLPTVEGLPSWANTLIYTAVLIFVIWFSDFLWAIPGIGLFAGLAAYGLVVWASVIWDKHIKTTYGWSVQDVDPISWGNRAVAWVRDQF